MTTTKISFNDKVLYLHILADVTELETTKKTLEVLSIKDELTSLYNRRYFNTIYEKELNRAIRSGEYIAFAVLDIDYFKNYNDSMGHIKGDEVLVQISSVMSSLFHRSGDYVFRMGGEEFCIIMIGVQPNNALQYLHKLREDIESLHISHPDSAISKYLTVSIGLYVSKLSIDLNVDYYKEADALLYEAKALRNCVVSNVESDSTVD
jgi:diguanylate cyclase (GGDEF)-like protein